MSLCYPMVVPRTAGYDNLTNWPDLTNRPTFSGSTLSWIGPTGGGASTASDTAQTQVLTNSGSVSSSSNGQTIQDLNIAGNLTITHTNVTVRRCRIVTASGSNVVSLQSSGLIMEDCEIDGGGSSAYGINARFGGAGSGTYRRLNIHGFENGIDPSFNGGETIIDCYIWGMSNTASGDPHYDNVEFDAGNGLTISHNQCVNNQGQNACINLDNAFGVLSNVTVNNNRCIGANYTIWIDATQSGSAVSNITITNNFLGIGANGYFNFTGFTPVHTGNVDYLTFVSVD